MRKKRKTVLWASLAVLAVLVVGVAVWGKQYYEDRYVGSDYYTVVPAGFDMSPVPLLNKDGKEAATGVNYELTAYNAQGEARPVSFTVYDPESGFSRGEIQPQPGTYLRVSASKQLVVGWGVVDASEIPAEVLAMINAGSGL